MWPEHRTFIADSGLFQRHRIASVAHLFDPPLIVRGRGVGMEADIFSTYPSACDRQRTAARALRAYLQDRGTIPAMYADGSHGRTGPPAVENDDPPEGSKIIDEALIRTGATTRIRCRPTLGSPGHALWSCRSGGRLRDLGNTDQDGVARYAVTWTPNLNTKARRGINAIGV